MPLLVPLVLAVALGFGLWLAALHVKYRDIGNVVPVRVLVGLFITPIIYPFSNVPDVVPAAVRAQPDGRRARADALDGAARLASSRCVLMIVTLVESVLLIATGVLYFGRAQRSFADVI